MMCGNVCQISVWYLIPFQNKKNIYPIKQNGINSDVSKLRKKFTTLHTIVRKDYDFFVK